MQTVPNLITFGYFFILIPEPSHVSSSSCSAAAGPLSDLNFAIIGFSGASLFGGAVDGDLVGDFLNFGGILSSSSNDIGFAAGGGGGGFVGLNLALLIPSSNDNGRAGGGSDGGGGGFELFSFGPLLMPSKKLIGGRAGGGGGRGRSARAGSSNGSTRTLVLV